jgi:hypothetical protein
MISKKKYAKPEIIRINLDKSINLMMRSAAPMPPMPMGMVGAVKGVDTPFTSPFDDKPFS